MNRNRAIVLLMLLYINTAIAQIKVQDKAHGGLSLTWKIVTNNYENKPQSRLSLLFTVAPNWMLPAKGWKIYFNFARQIVPGSETGGIQVQHINGDFFCLSPTADFKGIAAGKSLNIEFTPTEWMINTSDAPAGFYLVWDNDAGKTYNIMPVSAEPSVTPEQYMRSSRDKVGIATPASIFDQNKMIRDIPADSLMHVFPTPVAYQENPGNFKLDGSVRIQAAITFKSEKQYLKQTLSKLILPVKSAGNISDKVIKLQQKPMAAEAYELAVNSKSITISAATGAGIFYGIQSLKTLIDPQAYRHQQKFISIKNIAVYDAPRFAYRAFMLDVARNFQSKQEVLKLLDVLSLYKLNVLHLHLTDDEGWRLEIPTLPELTTVGGRRGHTLTSNNYLQPALGSGPNAGHKYGSGFYTKADFVEILKYATKRHVTVVPEIESPGHARAAIKAMDARYQHFIKLGQQENAKKYLLHDLHDTSTYLSVQYYNDNVIDITLPSAYNFINMVTACVVQMYHEAGAPLKTIHFGGDEVPAGAWQGSPGFKELAQTDTAIHSSDDLWLYYYTRVDSILKAHRLYLTAWEETGLVKVIQNNKKINVINTGLLNHDVHLEVWNNVLGWGAEDLAYKQANAGYKVILSCVSNLYFDMASEKAFEEPGYYWGGYVDVDKVFKFIPYNYFKNTTEDKMGNSLNRKYLDDKEHLTDTGKTNIIGIQGALWGETVKGPQRMEYMLLPKLLALAERAWAADPQWATCTATLNAAQLYNNAWSVFVNTISKRELPRLNYYSGGFNYRIPEPGATIQTNLITINSQLPGFKIYYTSDGSVPTMNSNLYRAPFPAVPKLKMAIFNDIGRSGRVIDLDNNK
jgi:hexosaminidase